MTTATGGTPACPDADRPHRLAAQLADMIPDAATVRVSLADPTQAWPHPRSVATDASGRRIDLSRTTSMIAARWVLRVWPDVDWTIPHVLDLSTATLTRSGEAAAGRGR